MIKNILKYYYDFSECNIKYNNDSYIINFNSEWFYFCPIKSGFNDLRDQYSLNVDINNFYPNASKIILNKFGNIITLFEKTNYILIRIGMSRNFNFEFIDFNYSKYKSLYRNEWAKLWGEKIDYFEFKLEHFKGRNKGIDKYFDFFCGLTENAIYLVQEVREKYNDLPLSIQHKRYNNFFYDNPINLIVDYRVRDCAETIKYKYLYENISILDIEEYISKHDYNKGELELLYARLLYPSLYFDILDKTIYSDYSSANFEEYEVIFSNYLNFLKFINQIKYFDGISKNVFWIKKS